MAPFEQRIDGVWGQWTVPINPRTGGVMTFPCSGPGHTPVAREKGVCERLVHDKGEWCLRCRVYADERPRWKNRGAAVRTGEWGET